jgi:hypothetical protein
LKNERISSQNHRRSVGFNDRGRLPSAVDYRLLGPVAAEL